MELEIGDEQYKNDKPNNSNEQRHKGNSFKVECVANYKGLLKIDSAKSENSAF